MDNNEKIKKIFDKYADAMRTRSLKWTFPRESRWGDRRIAKFIKYFCLPIKTEDVLGFLDTTVFRTGKEGYLFTYEGIVVKEVANKLYYLPFSKIKEAEIQKVTDEYYQTTITVWVNFLDGSKKQIFDFYIKRDAFVDYINYVVSGREMPENEEVAEEGIEDAESLT